MCAQVDFSDIRDIDEDIRNIELFKQSSSAEIHLDIPKTDLSEWIDKIKTSLTETDFILCKENLNRLSPSQFSNLLTLSQVYSRYTDWIDIELLISEKNVKRSYRSTITKNFTYSITNKNSRGNEAFSQLIEKGYLPRKTIRTFKSKETIFTRSFAVYRPKSFLKTYCEFVRAVLTAIRSLKYYYHRIIEMKLYFDEIDDSYTINVNHKRFVKSFEGLRNALKPFKSMEKNRLLYERQTFDKFSKIIVNRFSKQIINDMYNDKIHYTQIISHAQIICKVLLKWIANANEFLLELNEERKSKIKTILERLILYSPVELEDFSRRLLDASEKFSTYDYIHSLKYLNRI